MRKILMVALASICFATSSFAQEKSEDCMPRMEIYDRLKRTGHVQIMAAAASSHDIVLGIFVSPKLSTVAAVYYQNSEDENSQACLLSVFSSLEVNMELLNKIFGKRPPNRK